ncbi:MAG: 1-acyl-sn-glycerol-3-phosphate acyltransferase [Clostridiales bacterium]|nr:1-acyl-sn-glycerol-3-phosphate acyltransferase [Clostridiales bacterium]MDY3745647.1 lysophospholipid acyltransferase family protein [Lachnospiraceae bacterium]
MKRIILMMLRNIFFLPYAWIKLCRYAKHADDYTDEERYELLQYIDGKANKGGRINIEVHGVENIPKENGFMFFPNHQGLYDVLAIIQASPIPFSVVMKKELQNIPGLKQVFKCMKALAIDREDIKQSMKVIHQVTEEVKNGHNYLIFAEGTRTKNPNAVGEFKGGSFKSAIKAKCPIVPVVLIDAYKAFDTHSIKPLTVQVHFLEPMTYEMYGQMKSNEIASLVKRRIEKVIAENE